MNFEQIQWTKVFSRMLGLVVMEGMTLSGHPSIINKIILFSVTKNEHAWKIAEMFRIVAQYMESNQEICDALVN